jgi:hypothetical protein
MLHNKLSGRSEVLAAMVAKASNRGSASMPLAVTDNSSREVTSLMEPADSSSGGSSSSAEAPGGAGPAPSSQLSKIGNGQRLNTDAMLQVRRSGGAPAHARLGLARMAHAPASMRACLRAASNRPDARPRRCGLSLPLPFFHLPRQVLQQQIRNKNRTGSGQISASPELSVYECLGRGGYGVVYKGRWHRVPVAVKVGPCTRLVYSALRGLLGFRLGFQP